MKVSAGLTGWREIVIDGWRIEYQERDTTVAVWVFHIKCGGGLYKPKDRYISPRDNKCSICDTILPPDIQAVAYFLGRRNR